MPGIGSKRKWEEKKMFLYKYIYTIVLAYKDKQGRTHVPSLPMHPTGWFSQKAGMCCQDLKKEDSRALRCV